MKNVELRKYVEEKYEKKIYFFIDELGGVV